MFRKLLCWLGSHIWVVSHEKGTSVHYYCDHNEKLILEKTEINYKLQRCLCCKKEKRELLN